MPVSVAVYTNRKKKMNIQTQEIEIGKEKAVVISKKTWKKILAMLEDIDDVRAYDKAKDEDDGYRISAKDLKKRIKEKRK